MVDLVATVANNLLLLAGLVTVVAVVAVTAGAVARMHANRYRARMAELVLEQSKLQIVQRKALLKEFASAAVLLNDTERARLDAITEDLATLSRRAIALMGEVDARTTRLERGVEIAKMSGQLDTIRRTEARVFGQQS